VPGADTALDGLLKTVDLDARDREDDMQEALSDLEALMVRARDMVSLAQSLNAKLQDPSKATPQSSEEARADAAVRQSLISLGLSAPAITQEMAQTEKEYHISLARELGSVLLTSRNGRPPLIEDGKGKRGLIGLDEVWCLWNRARGVGKLPTICISQSSDRFGLISAGLASRLQI
jgi:ESCRT-II complex subunit VPS36